MENPKIYCAYDELVGIGELKPNPDNPNIHPEEQIVLLAKVLANGWRIPITVSTRSGMVVRGHGRLMAAVSMGLQWVPVDYQDYEDENQEISDLLADNKIPELSDFDQDKTIVLLEKLCANDVDLALAGFTSSDMAELLDDKRKLEELPEKHNVIEKDKRNLGIKGNQIKPVLYVDQIDIFEKALKKTGEMNRGKALIIVCENYLEKNRKKRQFDNSIESVASQAASI